jgi:hypothetical protein
MGRLSPTLRGARLDPSLCDRPAPRIGRARTTLRLREVAQAAYDAGRSCYFRPLFDRPRQWAEQRAPRSASPSQNPTDR